MVPHVFGTSRDAADDMDYKYSTVALVLPGPGIFYECRTRDVGTKMPMELPIGWMRLRGVAGSTAKGGFFKKINNVIKISLQWYPRSLSK